MNGKHFGMQQLLWSPFRTPKLTHPPTLRPTPPHPWSLSSCILDTLEDACNTRRLYVHFLCRVGWDEKIRAWNKLKFWLVDGEGKPLWQDGGGTGGAHPFFPCDEGPAWRGMIHRP